MADLPTRADLIAVARRSLRIDAQATPGTRVNPSMIDVAGSDMNLIFGACSIMGEEIVAGFARCLLSLLVETAKGDELDRIAYDRFGITRKPANAARADLVLARPTFVAGGGTLAAGARETTARGEVFALETDVVFGATDLTKTARGIAQVVGPTQNVVATAISSWIDQPFDSTITVSNPANAAGGTDVETDAQFRGRIRAFFLTVRRGTLSAIRYGALGVPGVAVATALDVVNPGSGLPAGAVQAVVADANGFSTSSIEESVRNELLSWRAGGIPVFVSGGQVVYEPVTFKLAFQDGVNSLRAAEEVRATAVAAAQFYAPGQALLRSDMFAAARAVPGVIVRQDAVVVPAGDVEPTEIFETIRIRPQDVTFI